VQVLLLLLEWRPLLQQWLLGWQLLLHAVTAASSSNGMRLLVTMNSSRMRL
jgi:hypothetical protein